MKLVYIEWCDAVSNANWFDKKELDKWCEDESEIIKQVGWIYKETNEYIVLVSRLSESNNGAWKQFGSLQKIPKTWIYRRVVLNKHITKKTKKK